MKLWSVGATSAVKMSNYEAERELAELLFQDIAYNLRFGYRIKSAIKREDSVLWKEVLGVDEDKEGRVDPIGSCWDDSL